jgi:hypothetical protein
VNFGDKTLVRGGEQGQPLADVSVSESMPLVCYATARVEPAGANAVPLVQVEWGNGGASMAAREYCVYRRLRVPVVGSRVRMTGRLVGASGKPLPSGSAIKCTFVAFVAPGSDGETLRNTQWTAQQGSEGLVSDSAEQLLTVQGYPATPAARWLMIFDATARPADGAFPVMATPARRAFRLDRFDSQGFRRGVFWAASSTPMTLTFEAAALLRVDVEVLT